MGLSSERQLRNELEVSVYDASAAGLNVCRWVRTLISVKRECLDIAVPIKGIVHRVDITSTNSLTLDNTEMNGLLLQVVPHNIDNRELRVEDLKTHLQGEQTSRDHHRRV